MCIYVFVCVACVCAVCVLVCAIRAVFVLVRVASAQICCWLNLCCLQMTKKLLLVFLLCVCVCVCVCAGVGLDGAQRRRHVALLLAG
jgi:hypothetical protein